MNIPEEKTMQDLHKIRSRHYDGTKRLPSKDLAAHINRESAAVEREISSVREKGPVYGDMNTESAVAPRKRHRA
jgi:hypothetical protein